MGTADGAALCSAIAAGSCIIHTCFDVDHNGQNVASAVACHMNVRATPPKWLQQSPLISKMGQLHLRNVLSVIIAALVLEMCIWPALRRMRGGAQLSRKSMYIVGCRIVTLANVSGSVIQPIIYAFSVTQLFYFQLNEISVSTLEGMGHSEILSGGDCYYELTFEELQVLLFRGYMTAAESCSPRIIIHVNQVENLADCDIMNLPNLVAKVKSCVRPRCMSTKVILGMLIDNVLDAKTYAWVESFSVSLFSFSEKS